MATRIIEIWVGIFIAAGFVALFMLAMKVSNLASYSSDAGFEVTARFENISGLKVRSPVTMSGVTIGRVSKIEFDDKALQAIVTMEVNSKHNTLPKDTSASIYTAGLLGEKYIGLEPGGDEDSLKQGDVIMITQDSLVLEKLIAQFVSNVLSGNDKEKTTRP